MNLLELPQIVLIDIFENLTYEEVSKKRLICRRIDQICQNVLNCGFNKIVRQHAISFKQIKALLPRRESERRNHCLARHADILTSVETRISMLSMTYSKYIDLNLCCFIPGRVLDEILRILGLIAKTQRSLRPHEVLQELRDISSMAIEHFDEKIANTLKRSIVESSSGRSRSSYSSSGSGSNGLDAAAAASRSRLAGAGLGNIVVARNTPCTMNAASTSAGQCGCAAAIRQQANALVNFGPPTPLLDDNIRETAAVTMQTRSSNSKPVISRVIGGSTQHEVPSGCTQARSAMIHFKKLEVEHKKMQRTQLQLTRRLQQAFTAITEQNTQIVELKKRMEDLDAKNRELSANIKQINTGEPTSPPPAVVAAEGDETDVVAVIAAATSITPPASKNDAISKKRRHDGNEASTSAAAAAAALISEAPQELPKKPRL